MKLILIALSLTIGTFAVSKTVEWMNVATNVVEQAS